MIELAIGQDAVDVHEQQLDLRGTMAHTWIQTHAFSSVNCALRPVISVSISWFGRARPADLARVHPSAFSEMRPSCLSAAFLCGIFSRAVNLIQFAQHLIRSLFPKELQHKLDDLAASHSGRREIASASARISSSK
jgi:hypothetical protein